MISHVQQGQRFSFPAEAYNAFVDAAVARKGSIFDNDADGELLVQDPSFVTVVNDTSDVRTVGQILGLGAPRHPATDPNTKHLFRSGPLIAGEMPTKTGHQYKIGVLLDDLPKQTAGRLLVSGLVVCQVDVTALIHPRATVKDNDATQLVSDFWGCAEIVSKVTQTGLQWVLVRMGPFGGLPVRGKTAVAINKGLANTVNVWTGIGAGAVVSNPLVTITNAFNPYANLGSAKFVTVTWVNDSPEMIAAEC